MKIFFICCHCCCPDDADGFISLSLDGVLHISWPAVFGVACAVFSDAKKDKLLLTKINQETG